MFGVTGGCCAEAERQRCSEDCTKMVHRRASIYRIQLLATDARLDPEMLRELHVSRLVGTTIDRL